VSHSPPDGARMRDPRIFTPGSVLYKSCGSRVSVREAHADFCFGPPAESLVCVLRTASSITDKIGSTLKLETLTGPMMVPFQPGIVCFMLPEAADRTL
jgi:hypothetical protein